MATEINTTPIKILELAKKKKNNNCWILWKIYNLSFPACIFADSLKNEKVTPVYKTGSKLSAL